LNRAKLLKNNGVIPAIMRKKKWYQASNS